MPSPIDKVARTLLLKASTSPWLRARATKSAFVRRSVSAFMPGERLADALEAAAVQQRMGARTIFTRLGENLTAVADAAAVAAHYVDALDRIAAAALDTEISVKPTQLGLDFDEGACLAHLRKLVEHSGRQKRIVWIDMESSPYVDATLRLYRQLRERSEYVGVALQAYLHRTAADLEALMPLGPAIRIVKGAYLESPSLVYTSRPDIDENFFRLASRMLGEQSPRPGTLLHVATHDDRLIDRLSPIAAAQNSTPYRFAMLYGIRRPLQQRLLAEKRPLTVLIAYGEYWYPWYMRRLAERPANLSFLVKNLFTR